METWLDSQKAPATKVLLALIGCVAIAQLLAPSPGEARASWFAIFHNWGGIPQAGLVKNSYFEGEWWRLFTAPLMHGNIVHLFMNGSAMIYLGKRLEVLARWPHLVLTFLFSACAGGIASAHFVAAPSVGASGGLMGWLGFLLVFETLHRELIPLRSRKRLAAGVFVTALIGLVGYRFIDNAAHVGGLFAGMTYAFIVFPRSSSGKRPNSTLTDRLAGSAALLAITLAAVAAFLKILGH
jgi:membrane associated rhomboid family serine protease